MEFHWPVANCAVLHNQINVLAPSFLRSPLSGGLLMLKLVLVGGTGRRRSTWRRRQMCEKVLLRGSSGLLVSAFDLRDRRTASQGFGCRCILLRRLHRECKKWRGPVMWKIPCKTLHALLRLWGTFRIHAVDVPPLCPVTKVGGGIHLIKSLWLICSREFYEDKRAGSKCLTYNRHNKDDVSVSCRLEREICQARSWEQRSLMSQTFVWSINSYDHILTFSILLSYLNMCLFSKLQKHIQWHESKTTWHLGKFLTGFNREVFWSSSVSQDSTCICKTFFRSSQSTLALESRQQLCEDVMLIVKTICHVASIKVRSHNVWFHDIMCVRWANVWKMREGDVRNTSDFIFSEHGGVLCL